MANENLRSLGEFGLIRRIQQQAGSADHLVKGIGDDCAIQRQDPTRELLTSTDMLIEGVHFKRQWISMEDLGHKSAAVNISDIAAMGGRPKSLFLGVACPADIKISELEKFTHGFIAEIKNCGAVLAGGDTCRSLGPLIISVTVQGEVEAGKAICRDGAKVGDFIYVSGTLGDSAAALDLLLRNEPPEEFLLLRHNRPQARVALGCQLANQQLATAMLDLSDGLISDLGHILETAALGADLELTSIPLSAPFLRLLKENPQLIDLALSGGEDYELLFTSPHHDLQHRPGFETPVTRIGTISARPGIRMQRADGSRHQCLHGGFDHFT